MTDKELLYRLDKLESLIGELEDTEGNGARSSLAETAWDILAEVRATIKELLNEITSNK